MPPMFTLTDTKRVLGLVSLARSIAARRAVESWASTTGNGSSCGPLRSQGGTLSVLLNTNVDDPLRLCFFHMMNDSGYGNRAKARAAVCNKSYRAPYSTSNTLSGARTVVQTPFISRLNAVDAKAKASASRCSNRALVWPCHLRVAT